MNEIVRNKDTGAEYTIVYLRGNKVILARSCSVGFLTIDRSELTRDYEYVKDVKITTTKHESLEELQLKLNKEYNNLRNLKDNYPNKLEEIRDSELRLKTITTEVNRLVKILLSK